MSISNPFDVYKSATHLNTWKNFVYSKYLTKKLIHRADFNGEMIRRLNEEDNAGVDMNKIHSCYTTF